jgi:hypothetical protein
MFLNRTTSRHFFTISTNLPVQTSGSRSTTWHPFPLLLNPKLLAKNGKEAFQVVVPVSMVALLSMSQPSALPLLHGAEDLEPGEIQH